jgi:hypothetical protein
MDETSTALVTEPAEIDMIVEERAPAPRDLFN